MGGGCTQPHALGSAGIAATTPLKTYPSLILKLAKDCSREKSDCGLLLPEYLVILWSFLELADEFGLLYMLLFLEAKLFRLLVGTVYNAGKGSAAHVVVLSMKRAIWPLFIPYWDERSGVLKLRSSGKPFPEASSRSPYCINARSCRYDLISSASLNRKRKSAQTLRLLMAYLILQM